MQLVITLLSLPLLALGNPLAAPRAETPEADTCGGFAGAECPSKQQTCVYPPGNSLGECIGKQCGGFAPQINPCPKSQICVYTNTQIADFPGNCLSPNIWCGGIVGRACPDNAPYCVPNPQSSCVYGKHPDCQGLCSPVKPRGAKGS